MGLVHSTRQRKSVIIFFNDDDDVFSSYVSKKPSYAAFKKATQTPAAPALAKPITPFEPLKPKQVKNSLGAFVWQVDDMTKLQRYLFLGNDCGIYKASQENMQRDKARCVDRLIGSGKGKEVVDFIRAVSLEGRAPKQQPTLFALAICARSNNMETKKAAYESLTEICRIPTHLFLFVKYCEEMSAGTGWGRAHRRAIKGWYASKAEVRPLGLARLVTKYGSREGWSHKDLFRLSHIKPSTDALKLIVRFVVAGVKEAKKLHAELGEDEDLKKLMEYMEATDVARKTTDETKVIELIDMFQLEREHIATQLLNSTGVWEALLSNIQMMALIRNLGKVTSLALIPYDGEVEKAICEKLRDVELLKKQRVHPFNVLIAYNTYKKGRGDKGNLAWIPNIHVKQALEDAYYLSFKAVESTGLRYLLAIDVSGSMNVPCIGSTSITCRDAAAAMMMTTARTEEHFDVVAFSHELTPLGITKDDKLEEVLEKTSKLRFGGTDCALPMTWADQTNKKYDVFIVYTDNETWYGKIHPAKALQEYRLNQGIPDAKLIVVGMCSNGFTIADPDDFGMLDVVGFDSGATETMAKFAVGKL